MEWRTQNSIFLLFSKEHTRLSRWQQNSWGIFKAIWILLPKFFKNSLKNSGSRWLQLLILSDLFFTYHVKHKAINANWGSFATFLPHTNVSSVMFQKSSSCVANPDRNRPHPTLIKNSYYCSKSLKCFKMYPIWKVLRNKCIFLSQKRNSYSYFYNLMDYECHEITILP